MIRDGIDGNGRQWDNVIRGDIMFKINPYRPGEGLLPTYLAGRDEDIYRRLLMWQRAIRFLFSNFARLFFKIQTAKRLEEYQEWRLAEAL